MLHCKLTCILLLQIAIFERIPTVASSAGAGRNVIIDRAHGMNATERTAGVNTFVVAAGLVGGTVSVTETFCFTCMIRITLVRINTFANSAIVNDTALCIDSTLYRRAWVDLDWKSCKADNLQ